MKFGPRASCASLLAVAFGLLPASEGRAGEPLREGEMAGYLLVPHEKVAAKYNAGFSMYVAAWPLVTEYPGDRFQTGLFGTWMFAQYPGPKPANHYSDVEGGLGWWRDTRFATETPKFIMGGVRKDFDQWANGPGAGKGRDWAKPQGKYGIAQLSPWVLWPADGLNLKQGTCGQLVGYGYLPLPLTDPKPVTAGKAVPTGDQSWTLFLNTGNFKGPVAFFTPYFWSSASVEHPEMAGLMLDSRPSDPNKALQMETQHVPSVQAVDAKGDTYARVAPTSFPRNAERDSALVHRLTAYDRVALWDSVKAWFDGGPAASGAIDAKGAALHAFKSDGGSTWRIYPNGSTKAEKVSLDWKSFATPAALDAHTYGYKWNYDLVTKTDTKDGALATLPEYYKLGKAKNGGPQWVVVESKDVPAETGLAAHQFRRPRGKPSEAYVTPDDAKSWWKKPGPVAGPFHVRPGDGSVVTYSWYRFADQPALLNADLTDAEREALQKRVEKLHRSWTRDREYLPAPTIGALADIDPALIVTPPPGFEAGYVPIVTRQAAKE